MTLEEFEALPIQRRLRAPAYWMSGSGEGHEGENDLPFKAADEIDRLTAALNDCREKALEEAAEAVDGNGKACRHVAERLKKNGSPAMAEMQIIRAEQCEGIAEAIRSLSKAPSS